jgi:hypothetical protein
MSTKIKTKNTIMATIFATMLTACSGTSCSGESTTTDDVETSAESESSTGTPLDLGSETGSDSGTSDETGDETETGELPQVMETPAEPLSLSTDPTTIIVK